MNARDQVQNNRCSRFRQQAREDESYRSGTISVPAVGRQNCNNDNGKFQADFSVPGLPATGQYQVRFSPVKNNDQAYGTPVNVIFNAEPARPIIEEVAVIDVRTLRVRYSQDMNAAAFQKASGGNDHYVLTDPDDDPVTIDKVSQYSDDEATIVTSADLIATSGQQQYHLQ